MFPPLLMRQIFGHWWRNMESSIIHVIIPATAALAGVVISQIFSFRSIRVQKKHEKTVTLQEKFEQMAFHFSNSLEWFADISNANSFEELRGLSLSRDANHAMVLCKLYFPELSETIEQYVKAQMSCYKHALKCYHAIGRVGNVGACVHTNPKSEILINDLFQKKETAMELISCTATTYSRI